MRINLTPILMLTGFFVACGGTGDNFSDGGEGGGGFGGSPTMDGSSGGDDVISPGPDTGLDASLDTGGGKDSPTTTCTTNAECGASNCCDIPTGACYPFSGTCPVGVVDSGSDTAPY
jgi:hypothetical protein